MVDRDCALEALRIAEVALNIMNLVSIGAKRFIEESDYLK